jgi:hypothetical protein
MEDLEVIKNYLIAINECIISEEEYSFFYKGYTDAIKKYEFDDKCFKEEKSWKEKYKKGKKIFLIGGIISVIPFAASFTLLIIIANQHKYILAPLLLSIINFSFPVYALISGVLFGHLSKKDLKKANKVINDYPEQKKKNDEERKILTERLQQLLNTKNQAQEKFSELENKYSFKLPIKYQNSHFIEMSLEIISARRFKSLADLLALFDKKLKDDEIKKSTNK